MVTYKVYEGKYFSEDSSYSGYGIAMIIDERIDRIAEDITCDRERAEALASLFNSEELDPVHFEQAVEDNLTES